MKRKILSAAIISAMLLSGCSEGKGASKSPVSSENAPESSAGSEITSSANEPSAAGSVSLESVPAQSSHSGAPTVIAPGYVSIPEKPSEPETPAEPETPVEPEISETPEISEPVEVIEAPIVDSEIFGDYTVASGTRLSIGGEDGCFEGNSVFLDPGAALDVEGELYIAEGNTLTLSEGSTLRVSGKVVIDGSLVLSEGSYLILTDDSADVSGCSIEVRGNFDSIDCEYGSINVSIIVPPEREVIDGVTTVGGVVIANKSIKLPPSFGEHLSLNEVEPQVYNALEEMNAVAENGLYGDDGGHTYQNVSGYRSYYDQEAIFANYVSIYGYEEADTFSSQAGHSEHQTGLTMDIDAFEESYADTPEGQWLAENCWKFGFIIRYPKGKENITGYTYEPWHVRWLGKSLAKLVYNSGLTLEEFLNVEGGTVVID